MASLSRSSGGTYHLVFRYDGKQFRRSLETNDTQQAKRKKAIVEQTLAYLKDGVLTLPHSATADQLWQFLRSAGKTPVLPTIATSVTLARLINLYFDSFPDGTKEANTLKTERYHLNHACRILGQRTALETIDPPALRRYIKTREKERGRRGRPVRPVTIRKELQTLRQIWEFAKSEGFVRGDNPVDLIKKPRKSQKPPFMCWDEIERRIGRGGLSNDDEADLWESLFLRETEVAEFLSHVKSVASSYRRFLGIYAAIAFCAYTGARRSEMYRCQIDDVNGQVFLREKKRAKQQRITFREVPLHPELAEILDQWLTSHPGGPHLFCKANQKSLDVNSSWEAFKAVTRNSKWHVLHGYHVLRHSFASNLARHSVDQYKIDEMMGHQTEEMRRRCLTFQTKFATQKCLTADADFATRRQGFSASVL